MSWNINDNADKTFGKKTDIPRFSQMLEKTDIFCLQETKGEFNLPNFCCTNLLRPDSRSGGVCIGVHKSLQQHTQRLSSGDPDIAGISISRTHLGSQRDLAIINVYDSPDNSAYKLRKSKDSPAGKETTLENVLSLLGKLADYDILLLGDFNARSGPLNHCPAKEDWTDTHNVNDLVCSRQSEDTVINERGKKLLDTVSSCNMTILNGNVLGDIFGNYTCSRYNGNSVVDYAIASAELREQIESFEVGDFTEYSDHRPIMCRISVPRQQPDSPVTGIMFEDAPRRPKWDPESFEQHFSLKSVLDKISKLSEHEVRSLDEALKLNDEITKLYQSSIPTGRENCKQVEKPRKLSTKPKHKWFDSDCMIAKRELNQLAKRYGRNASDSAIRSHYYMAKKEYKKLIKLKKSELIGKLNKDILNTKEIDWNAIKKLKSISPQADTLDTFDIENFRDFFKVLYTRKQNPPGMSEPQAGSLQNLQSLQNQAANVGDFDDCLNREISVEELKASIKELKVGKASGLDHIVNEQLKNSNEQLQCLLLKLFNSCLDFGAYPWSTTVITPLHKKGNISNPDNYRAIAIGSNLGKLFSTVLLKRLLEYRKEHVPDTVHQLGFCEGARTTDHLLTLQTCIEKYTKKRREKLYSCFVDFKKAFDSISREALIYKLCKMGLKGKFLNCLSYMYSHSKARMKIVKKLSKEFDIESGTEQGHPMSPELFKTFIHDLSVELGKDNEVLSPILNNIPCSHLLWADDLVLLSLDGMGLSKLIKILEDFCKAWGLEVNIDKTAILIFNPTGRQLKESFNFYYNSKAIPSVKRYCYLGICFTISGKLLTAQALLKQKALRAYFGMKKYIDPLSVCKEAALKLFDSLILPVVSYGHQLWLPHTHSWRLMTNRIGDALLEKQAVTNAATDPIERLHLMYLKWMVQVPKRVSNAAIWGDFGRYPLAISLSKSTVSYLNRLILMDKEDSNKLVRHAYVEQKEENLAWYSSVKAMTSNLDPQSSPRGRYAHPNAKLCKARAQEQFVNTWEGARYLNRKLGFYNEVKINFSMESYMKSCNNYDCAKVALLRTCGHKLNVETGRYMARREKPHLRCCSTCTNQENMELLFALPMLEHQLIEDEFHVLADCPRYTQLRNDTSIEVNRLVNTGSYKKLFDDVTVVEAARLIRRILEVRFPKQKKKKKKTGRSKSDPTNPRKKTS